MRSADGPREHVRRMRLLAVDQVSGDVLLSLLNAGQVKLGQRDARLLIDVSAVAHGHARPDLPEVLTKQIEQMLGQLRLGQVSAESHASRHGQPEEDDPGQVPARRRQVQRSDPSRLSRRVVPHEPLDVCEPADLGGC